MRQLRYDMIFFAVCKVGGKFYFINFYFLIFLYCFFFSLNFQISTRKGTKVPFLKKYGTKG